MLFENKFERARRVQREATGLDKEEEQERRRQQEKEKLEKGDLFSLLLSAFYSLFLPAVAVLVALVLLVCLLFGVFSHVSSFLLPILITTVVLWLLLLRLRR